MNTKGGKILIVDDEEDLCEILQFNLNNAGFTTDVAHSSEESLKKSLYDYDLFLLDVMMGAISGFRLAEKLRKEYKIKAPIIFLTAKDTENDVLTGFNLGADDYISKPFSINELTARVKAVLKRSETERKKNYEILKFGDIELDNVRKRVLIDNVKIELTKKEYEILLLLLQNIGQVFSREDILHRIWGGNVIVSDRTVDVNITRIRSKIGKYGSCLKNKTGFGYFFEF
jgi:two-component system, OmpR family, alkaline phosphatase synthesis response regulator PhoP